ncbi:MAG: endonuclease/exonuclease/phosphatase family protein [Planctomycetes bacterium]|nr:endonuclease/exonuclease/phosphatase family protein [Planctomycetota bacterium]
MNILRATLAIAFATLPLTSQDTLRVGTWNLEHFGGREPRRTEQDVQAIAEFIRTLDVGVLAVQEVRNREAIGKLVEQLGGEWNFVLGTTGSLSGADGIHVGFLFDGAKVEFVQAEELLQLPSRTADGKEPIFHRKPVAAVFRARGGGIDFRAITVHLKASRGDKNVTKRRGEVNALRTYVEELLRREGEDQDVVILGDFNHTYRALAFQDFTKGGFVEYLKAPRTPPTIVHFDEPIDHVAVTKGIRDDLASNRLDVHGTQAMRDKEKWRTTYSDHIPVTFELTNVDRDPDATFAPVGSRQWLRPGGAAAALGSPAEAAVTKTDPATLAVGATVTVTFAGQNGIEQLNGRVAAVDGSWLQVLPTEHADPNRPATLAIPVARVVQVEVWHAR